MYGSSLAPFEPCFCVFIVLNIIKLFIQYFLPGVGLPLRCLSPDAAQRPDIVAVSSLISDLMMRLMDGLYTSQNALERRAERDRKRAQKYFLEKHKSGTNCCHSDLTQVS